MSKPSTRPPSHPRNARAASTRPEPARPETSRKGRLTVADFCAEMEISRRTFHEWRAKGRAPRCHKLPNGDLRIARAAFEAWLAGCEENA